MNIGTANINTIEPEAKLANPLEIIYWNIVLDLFFFATTHPKAVSRQNIGAAYNVELSVTAGKF